MVVIASFQATLKGLLFSAYDADRLMRNQAQSRRDMNFTENSQQALACRITAISMQSSD